MCQHFFLYRLIGTMADGFHKSHSLGLIAGLPQMAIVCGFNSPCCSLNRRTFDEIPKFSLESLTCSNNFDQLCNPSQSDCLPSVCTNFLKSPYSVADLKGWTAVKQQEYTRIQFPHFMVLPNISKYLSKDLQIPATK